MGQGERRGIRGREEEMKTLDDYPHDTWRRYRVHYTGGACPYQEIEAPNKTYARMLTFLRPGLKITKIEEVHSDRAE